ncbi:hypothetical protein [Burkholderia orbicola]|uniref:hypothetical protein n=1 Tax=Burkholderia orbicola TaxID=2978683 RepID=UPI002FE2EA10
MLRRTEHYKAFYLGSAALIATDGPGPSKPLPGSHEAASGPENGPEGDSRYPESGRKSLKWAKRVTITDLRDLDLPRWFVWLVRAIFILQNWLFLVIFSHFLAKLRFWHVSLFVACVIFSTA